jgi:NAD(P)-dependent dehydrogenase (short-subunit alcohol dehydrogenase family)
MLEMHGYHATVGNDSNDANVWICLTQPHWQALLFAKAAARRLGTFPGAFITVEDNSRPWDGGLSGLAKTAALEWPGVRVKAIRVDLQNRAPEQIAKALLDELLTGGPEQEIELAADGSRYAPEVIETGWDSFDPAVPAQLPPNPVIIATGGARGVTAACLQELAKTLRPRFVLFGRTPLADEPAATRSCPDAGSVQNARLAAFRAEGRSVSPLELKSQTEEILAAREVRRNIHALERAGAQVRYFALDVRDASAVDAALADVRSQWGPIHGVIHAAGVLADKLIADITCEQFETVFSTKVGGLRVLLDATAQDPLAMLCMFSSVAARYGNRGQAAYAMANEVLNRVAHAEARRRGKSCIVRSINWGPWESGMVTPALAKHFAGMNVPLIGLAEGARTFAKEMLSGASDAEVVIGGPLSARVPELTVHIQHATHPHLNDHVIQDIPVLPVVEAVGLMLRAAAEQGQSEETAYCADVKVLRGIRLEKFHDGGNLLTVRRSGAGTFELVSPDGTRHYEASLWPSLNGTAFSGSLPPPDPGPLSAAPWNETEIYGKLLFHGPQFHMIRGIEGVSENGIAGTLRARNGERWRHGARGYDPGMLDGGLQLARLWGFLKLGQATLPMRIAGIRILRDAGAGPVECRVSASAGANRTLCDIAFFSLEKELLALMTGVEMYAASGA